MRYTSFFCFFIILLSSCGNRDAQPSASAPAALSAAYQISAEEGSEEAVCLFRFFKDARSTESVGLGDGRLLLNGQPITPDSAVRNGVYYEARLPLSTFSKPHTVTIAIEGFKTIDQSFSFQPFALAQEWGNTLPRQDWTIMLNGLHNGAALRVLLTDTSFASADINEVMKVSGNSIHIAREALRHVVSGPVILQLLHEKDSALNSRTRLQTTYTISREFELID